MPDLRILVELRPALDGHAGIPQETRLLFRMLATFDRVTVDGLLQSSDRMLARGLSEYELGSPGHSADRRINRSSRVVVSLQPAARAGRLLNGLVAVRIGAATLSMLVLRLFGRNYRLGCFDPEHFSDFVWRSLFARTLPPSDFELVTSKGLRVAQLPWSAMHAAGVLTSRFGRAIYPRLATDGFDMMIAETPYPASVSAGTRLVVRYHDAIPMLMPHTIINRARHQAMHYRALRHNVRDGAWFACVSDATRRNLLAIFPEVAERAVTIHNMVSAHYFDEPSPLGRVAEIVRTRRSRALHRRSDITELPGTPFDYLLMVSTIEPRKNHAGLIAAWEHLRSTRFPALRLVIVGAFGWEHKKIVERFRPGIEIGSLFALEDVAAQELRVLYRHAAVTVCPSFSEGFDFAGIEAMRSGGIVAASDIAVHREVFDDAAIYFAPYDVEAMAEGIAALLEPTNTTLRERIRAVGAQVAERYLPDRIRPRWEAFLARVAGAAN